MVIWLPPHLASQAFPRVKHFTHLILSSHLLLGGPELTHISYMTFFFFAFSIRMIYASGSQVLLCLEMTRSGACFTQTLRNWFEDFIDVGGARN